MPSPIQQYHQQQRQSLMEQFKEYQQTTTVLAENKCRYSMLFCILREYVKHEQKCTANTGEIYQKIEAILSALQAKQPNFLDTGSYTILMTELRNKCYSPPVNTADTIKLSFARRLSGLLTPTVFSKDISANLTENEILPESEESQQQLNLSNDTQMLLNGYYEATIGLLKSCVNDTWIASL